MKFESSTSRTIIFSPFLTFSAFDFISPSMELFLAKHESAI